MKQVQQTNYSKMKQILLISALFLLAQSVAGQQQDLQADIPVYFNEIKEATKKSYKLWNMDLYGGILLIDPQTRQL
ncbi:MAG: hypothetical protein LBU84_01060, partial [Prevotella sp.]|nr:hypothetical protein [Prevotella sp.]